VPPSACVYLATLTHNSKSQLGFGWALFDVPNLRSTFQTAPLGRLSF